MYQEAMKFHRNRYGLNYPLPSYEDLMSKTSSVRHHCNHYKTLFFETWCFKNWCHPTWHYKITGYMFRFSRTFKTITMCPRKLIHRWSYIRVWQFGKAIETCWIPLIIMLLGSRYERLPMLRLSEKKLLINKYPK